MFSAGVSRPLRARHYLPSAGPGEQDPHSHPYQVEWICFTSDLDSHGYAVDIAAMCRILESELAKIDNVLLNDLPFFADVPPSLEQLSRYLAQRLTTGIQQLSSQIPERMELRIHESDSEWAGYTWELPQ
ncbi:MAG: 6-pyruvoyl trahydropterin synthase family protein [Spirochaeta sp.]